MTISPLDYRYGRDEAKHIWSREGRHSRQLEVERALVWAHCQLGKVSPEDYDVIADIADPGIVTADRVDEIETETKHDSNFRKQSSHHTWWSICKYCSWM